MLWLNNLILRLKLGIQFSVPDPFSLKAPTFPSEDEISRFKKKSSLNINLLCEAQGYPIPSFRYG